MFTGKVQPLENKVSEISNFIKAVLDGKEVTWPDDEPKFDGKVPESTRMKDLIIMKAQDIVSTNDRSPVGLGHDSAIHDIDAKAP